MRELSIFVDESGDFGKYDYHSPYYIVSLVFHDQSNDLSDSFKRLNDRLDCFGLKNTYIHTGPLIRGDGPYHNLTFNSRRKMLSAVFSFIRESDISYKSFSFEKKEVIFKEDLIKKIQKELNSFILDNYKYFTSFDSIKIYYDNGQLELKKAIKGSFQNLLSNVTLRIVPPEDYRLFQVADYICTLKLLELKMNNSYLTKNDYALFIDDRSIRKNYLKLLKKKEFK